MDGESIEDVMLAPVRNLFESHFNVSNLERAVHFYTEVLGFELAKIFPDRRVAFVWIGEPGESMLGLWESGSSPQRVSLHVAFSVRLNDLLRAVDALRNAGIEPLGFEGELVDEPVVLAWMPAASIYFRDPDDNLLEFIAMLEESAWPELGVITWSRWRNRSRGGSEKRA
jgi:lactoylglutathione lyase